MVNTTKFTRKLILDQACIEYKIDSPVSYDSTGILQHPSDYESLKNKRQNINRFEYSKETAVKDIFLLFHYF